MEKIFATMAVLSLVVGTGTVALAAPVNASSTWLFEGASNQGNRSKSRRQAANVAGCPGAGLQVEAVMDMEQTSEPVASVIAGSSVPADEATVWLLVANAAARRAHTLPGSPPVRFVDTTSEMFRQHGVQLASGSAARTYIGLTDTIRPWSANARTIRQCGPNMSLELFKACLRRCGGPSKVIDLARPHPQR